jgi:hypothetical protein
MICLIQRLTGDYYVKKQPKNKPVFKTIRVGTNHFLRSGAGAHVDKKKEMQKILCRTKPRQND